MTIERTKDILGRQYKSRHRGKTVDGDRRTLALCNGKEKHNDKDTGAPWFWVGFGIIVAGGAGFIIYKKVGRKNV